MEGEAIGDTKVKGRKKQLQQECTVRKELTLMEN